MQAVLNWENVEHFKNKHQMPLILKGIGTGEDATSPSSTASRWSMSPTMAAASSITAAAVIEVLPEVVQAVAGGGRCGYVDGGLSRGTDS